MTNLPILNTLTVSLPGKQVRMIVYQHRVMV